MAQIKQMQASFPENAVLFKENDTSREMFILLSGEVEVSKGGKVLATVNTNGSFLGEMATLLNATRTATVRTTKKSVFLKILPENIETMFKVTPELGYKLSKTLAERLASVSRQLADIAATPAPAKEGAPVRLRPEQVAAAQKEMEKPAPPPPGKDPAKTLAFLTRTEVHKDALRLHFNLQGEALGVEEAVSALDVPDTLAKLVLKEFCDAGLMKAEGERISFQYDQDLCPLEEQWIYDHGLFRSSP